MAAIGHVPHIASDPNDDTENVIAYLTDAAHYAGDSCRIRGLEPRCENFSASIGTFLNGLRPRLYAMRRNALAGGRKEDVKGSNSSRMLKGYEMLLHVLRLVVVNEHPIATIEAVLKELTVHAVVTKEKFASDGIHLFCTDALRLYRYLIEMTDKVAARGKKARVLNNDANREDIKRAFANNLTRVCRLKLNEVKSEFGYGVVLGVGTEGSPFGNLRVLENCREQLGRYAIAWCPAVADLTARSLDILEDIGLAEDGVLEAVVHETSAEPGSIFSTHSPAPGIAGPVPTVSGDVPFNFPSFSEALEPPRAIDRPVGPEASRARAEVAFAVGTDPPPLVALENMDVELPADLHAPLPQAPPVVEVAVAIPTPTRQFVGVLKDNRGREVTNGQAFQCLFVDLDPCSEGMSIAFIFGMAPARTRLRPDLGGMFVEVPDNNVSSRVPAYAQCPQEVVQEVTRLSDHEGIHNHFTYTGTRKPLLGHADKIRNTRRPGESPDMPPTTTSANPGVSGDGATTMWQLPLKANWALGHVHGAAASRDAANKGEVMRVTRNRPAAAGGAFIELQNASADTQLFLLNGTLYRVAGRSMSEPIPLETTRELLILSHERTDVASMSDEEGEADAVTPSKAPFHDRVIATWRFAMEEPPAPAPAPASVVADAPAVRAKSVQAAVIREVVHRFGRGIVGVDVLKRLGEPTCDVPLEMEGILDMTKTHPFRGAMQLTRALMAREAPRVRGGGLRGEATYRSGGFRGTRGGALSEDQASLSMALESLPMAVMLFMLKEDLEIPANWWRPTRDAHSRLELRLRQTCCTVLTLGGRSTDMNEPGLHCLPPELLYTVLEFVTTTAMYNEIERRERELPLRIVTNGADGIMPEVLVRPREVQTWRSAAGNELLQLARGEDWLGARLTNLSNAPVVAHCLDVYGEIMDVLELNDKKFVALAPNATAQNATEDIMEANLRWVIDGASPITNYLFFFWRYTDANQWMCRMLPYQVVGEDSKK